MAAGWTTLFCDILLTVLHYILMKRACRRNQVRENIFPEYLLLAIVLCVLVLSLAVLGLYKLSYFRYVILLLEILAVLGCRRKLIRVWNQLRKGEEKNGE